MDADTCTVSLHTEANILIRYLGTKWQKSGKLLSGVFAGNFKPITTWPPFLIVTMLWKDPSRR